MGKFFQKIAKIIKISGNFFPVFLISDIILLIITITGKRKRGKKDSRALDYLSKFVKEFSRLFYLYIIYNFIIVFRNNDKIYKLKKIFRKWI